MEVAVATARKAFQCICHSDFPLFGFVLLVVSSICTPDSISGNRLWTKGDGFLGEIDVLKSAVIGAQSKL